MSRVKFSFSSKAFRSTRLVEIDARLISLHCLGATRSQDNENNRHLFVSSLATVYSVTCRSTYEKRPLSFCRLYTYTYNITRIHAIVAFYTDYRAPKYVLHVDIIYMSAYMYRVFWNCRLQFIYFSINTCKIDTEIIIIFIYIIF